MRKFILFVLTAAALIGALTFAAASGKLGRAESPGVISDQPSPPLPPPDNPFSQAETRTTLGALDGTDILFGDPRVYTRYSDAAHLLGLSALGGDGARPVADACDYARFCSAVDFWGTADHAELLTPARWRETLATLSQCNTIARQTDTHATEAFAGFTWSPVSAGSMTMATPAQVLFAETTPELAAVQPIGAGGLGAAVLRHDSLIEQLGLIRFAAQQSTLNFASHTRDTRAFADCPDDATGADCRPVATTERELQARLANAGFDYQLTNIASTYGLYTAALAEATHDDTATSELFEIMSGYGSAEEYRVFRDAIAGSDNPSCPPPADNHLPACWRAGELIAERCRRDGLSYSVCEQRAANARQLYVSAGVAGHLTMGGETPDDWLDAGQCRDCFLPAFNYRPQGSAQYRLARRQFDAAGQPQRRYLGFTGASASHRARPGNGYKERDRALNTDAFALSDPRVGDVLFGQRGDAGATAAPLAPHVLQLLNGNTKTSARGLVQTGPRVLGEHRRANAYRFTGALTAVHAASRTREDIWAALAQRAVYATSGDRILLWFDLENTPDSRRLPMGSRTTQTSTPRFVVRAAGAYKQRAGCADATRQVLGAQRLNTLCGGECFHPSEERKLISRIEVVRVRPQQSADEPIDALIDDPWLRHACEPDPAGCRFTFTDPDYVAGQRDTTYYVRAIESPSPAVNAGTLECVIDADGHCIAVNPCNGEDATGGDCRALIEERAWSSPIYVEWPR